MTENLYILVNLLNLLQLFHLINLLQIIHLLNLIHLLTLQHLNLLNLPHLLLWCALELTTSRGAWSMSSKRIQWPLDTACVRLPGCHTNFPGMSVQRYIPSSICVNNNKTQSRYLHAPQVDETIRNRQKHESTITLLSV